MGWVPAYFNAPVDPTECVPAVDRGSRRHVDGLCPRSRSLRVQLQQKVIPLSHSPFDSRQDDPDFDEYAIPELVVEEEEETGVEAVPEWLELVCVSAWPCVAH